MTIKDQIRSISFAVILSGVSTTAAYADPVTASTTTATGASELAMRWLGPSRPEAAAETAEEKLAVAIRLLISGARRDGFDGSGGYHTDPQAIWQARQ